jgi:hypothetical protein
MAGGNRINPLGEVVNALEKIAAGRAEQGRSLR